MQRARKWQTSTILGKLLTPSVLPLDAFKLNPNQRLLAAAAAGNVDPILNQYRYFQTPTQMTRQDVEIVERNMHDLQRLIKKEMHKFFHESLIKSNTNQQIRSQWFKWLGACLADNKAKAQEWSNYAQSPLMPTSGAFASDGFFLNLLDLALTYSMPFCFNTLDSSARLFRINFNYANSQSSGNFSGFDKETRMIPFGDDESAGKELIADCVAHARFNQFITECFFVTNSLFRLAFLSLNQKIVKLNGELARWQQTYQDLMMSQTQDPQMVRIKV